MAESMGELRKTVACGALDSTWEEKEVTLMGWIQKRRDHGGLIFVDLRDREGLVQVVFSPEISKEYFSKAEAVRNEYVIAVQGKVSLRPEGTKNSDLKTGEVEIYAHTLRVLNEAKTPPFMIEDQVDVDELIRLKYRYLDLRRQEMKECIQLRHKTVMAMRRFLDSREFLEIETPMLTKSSPEGARDYLVPSRVHPGEFFALPQSPQLYKQILMVAGMERYYQIVKCFRDEDLRADRQPEFTQLDMEMSFMTQEEIMQTMEEMTTTIFQEVMGVEIKLPFQQLTYEEAMSRYGSDKPDLRFGMELIDVADLVIDSGFKVFASIAANGGHVKAILGSGCAKYSRKEIDDLTKYVGVYGAKGLAYIVMAEEGPKSPILKFFTEEEIENLVERMQAKKGDIIFFVADSPNVVADSLGHLRLELAARENLIDDNLLNFSWVVDFPLVEYDEEEKRFTAKHHPFTSPKEEDLALMETDPGKVRANAYDMVLNGVEIGGGSIRIHQREVQEKMFGLLNLAPEEIIEKFGFLLEAFEYGTPPHGGIAFGLDRLVMLMAKKESIRDVIAFPKTQSAADLMIGAPGSVSAKQLRELHVRSTAPKS